MIAQFLKNVILTAISAASVAAGISPQTDVLPRKPALGTQFEQGTTKVSRVIAGSSAEGALKVGDEITMIGTQKVENAPSLVQILNGCLSGKDYDFTVKRDGKEERITVHLKERAREISDKYDVIYDHVVSNGDKIRTIVTKPKKEGKFPVFMMMQGLGEFSMDYDLSRGGAYSQFVSHFANKDFVTIRVEKPGMGDSEGGPYVETDFWTEGDVYRQALKAVKQYPFVDPDQVFIYGHSMGGLYGPVIVGEQPIAGFIAASTVYKTWNEYWLENVRRQNVLAGMSRVAVDQDEKDIALMTAWILTEKRDPQELIKLFPRLETKVNQMVVDGKFLGRTLDFWTQLAGMNYAENWSKVTSPTWFFGDSGILSVRKKITT
ncbi:MAG: PDZ domain-containing protein [Fimbriimonadaceae bacterium]